MTTRICFFPEKLTTAKLQKTWAKMKENDPNLAQFGIHLPVPQAYTLTAGDKLVIISFSNSSSVFSGSITSSTALKKTKDDLKKNSEEEFKRIEEELKKTKEELKKTKEELKKNSEEELEKKAEEGYVRLDKKVDQLAKKEVLDNFSVFAKKIQDEVKLIHDVVSATIKIR
ncbi:hypothetical protein QL285_062232 [Trifolium repens]|nr:hypothetical protein QL285_062232 [Trifolium repens]